VLINFQSWTALTLLIFERTYVKVLQLVAVEVSADVDALATNDHDLLTVQDGLCHDGCQAAQQVASAVNDNGLKDHCSF